MESTENDIMLKFSFKPVLPQKPPLTSGDALIILVLCAFLYVGVRLGWHAPSIVRGPDISLSFRALPWYSLLSLGRMTAAYLLSLLFSLAYGYAAARRRGGEKVLLPLLDVLQSVPILSFLPVVLLSLSAVLPTSLAAEIAAIVLIFTSQAWNMTFSFYQSMTTLPRELKEAAAIFRLPAWLRFKTLELPFAALALAWNSMMSWSGGWFFLMAAEIFNVGPRDFRLPGLGSYLQTAANAGDMRAISAGIVTLVIIIVLLDQFVWRPLLAWSDKFKVEMVRGSEPPRSWFLEALSRSWLIEQLELRLWHPLGEKLDLALRSKTEVVAAPAEPPPSRRLSLPMMILCAILAAALLYGGFRGVELLTHLSGNEWKRIGLGTLATFLRVTVALAIALSWTLPVGVMIGTNRRAAELLQPLVQVVASIPATALFPVLLLALLHAPGGLNIVSTLLMLMGTQWYLLFNIIAGSSAIPQDLHDTTALLRLSRRERWRTLILPALFPYVVTGSITASGGAWNASIVAERVVFGGHTHETIGVGSLIAEATGRGDYPMLFAATLALVVTVVLLNRRVWRLLYRAAEDRFRME